MNQISRRWQLVVIWEADGKGTLKVDKEEEIRDEEKRLHVSVTPVEQGGGGQIRKLKAFS